PPPLPPLFPYTTLFRSSSKRIFHHFAGDPLVSKRHVRLDCPCEQIRILQDNSHMLTDSLTGHFRNVLPINGYGPFGRIIETEQRSEEHTSELQSRENLV